MDIILYNAGWMAFNVFLALLAILLGFSFLNVKKISVKIPLFILWLLFIPNTIYLVTDMKYFQEQFFSVLGYYKIILILQYVILFIFGIITFIMALYPFERSLSKKKSKSLQFKTILLIAINYLIAFGVALGRIERINSWDVFINLADVLEASITLANNKGVLLAIFVFGTFSSLIYFAAKKMLRIK